MVIGYVKREREVFWVKEWSLKAMRRFKGLKVPPWVRAHVINMVIACVKRERSFCKRVVSERDQHKGTG
jgi:hypothetical protein